MLKRIFLLVTLALLSALAWAADPTIVAYTSATGAVTVDSTKDGAWEIVDSLIVTADDTANVVITVSGVATMSPTDQLWLGFCDDSISVVDSLSYAASRNLDSVIIKATPGWYRGAVDVPFCISTVKGIDAQTTTDTIYVVAACGGSGGADKVILANVVLNGIIADR